MLRIKKLDIFISKQFCLLFIGTFFISQFVLMMQFLWKHIDELIGKGLSVEVLAQFFWYMALILVPQALPLAILLSSLICFGNLGESSELTAIKASGVSLIQSFRSLIVISVFIAIGSFHFQNDIGPEAQKKLMQLIISMKQKSPELEIPEGIFYDGIPQSNIYVQKKDLETGKLYGIMIYRMTGSYEDAAIILADSGMLQSSAEKKHLILNLWSGGWFENMRSQELAGSASVPYRRETFTYKNIVMDFDGDFSLTDASGLSGNAQTKSLKRIRQDLDSLNHAYDSIGNSYYTEALRFRYHTPDTAKYDKKEVEKLMARSDFKMDSLYAKLTPEKKREVTGRALSSVRQQVNDLKFKSMTTSDGDRMIRQHKIEYIAKFTLALSCIIFFFIGAPLGAIIRKGGLGLPIIVSVLVFIIYYILDNTGYRMSRGGMWSVWFGKGLSPAVLIPTAIFFTYKANNDSTVFNIDIWRSVFMRILGLRIKRNITRKEVTITDPDYNKDAERLARITEDTVAYSKEHSLTSLPNPINVFFKYRPDHEIHRISGEMESVIEDLSNTGDNMIISEMNKYPILVLKAHTRPFERKWLNIISAFIIPVGIFFYCRMCRFRLRLYRDLRTIKSANDAIIARINEKHDNGKLSDP